MIESQRHSFHLVDPSPWPISGSLGALATTVGGVMYMHSFPGGETLLSLGLLFILSIMFVWWRDVRRESTLEGHHTKVVQLGLRYGFLLFIVSGVMFFFAFFVAFSHSSLAPAVEIGGIWPPKGIGVLDPRESPFLNTIILISSGAAITWAHHAILAGKQKRAVYVLVATVLLATVGGLISPTQVIVFIGVRILSTVFPFHIRVVIKAILDMDSFLLYHNCSPPRLDLNFPPALPSLFDLNFPPALPPAEEAPPALPPAEEAPLFIYTRADRREALLQSLSIRYVFGKENPPTMEFLDSIIDYRILVEEEIEHRLSSFGINPVLLAQNWPEIRGYIFTGDRLSIKEAVTKWENLHTNGVLQSDSWRRLMKAIRNGKLRGIYPSMFPEGS